uniref:Glycosyltransferase n=1 Tax=Leersia perrieri TaxID=77586 RepID=A0A0D9VD48_9ORYZ
MGEEAPAATVSAAATASSPPHLLFICFPGQGHINPMLRLAKRIAAKGLLVTFSTTSSAGAKLVSSSAGGVSAGGNGVPLGRGRIRFEFLDDEFDGKEIDALMHHLETAGPPAFESLLRRQAAAGRPVACVVGNPFIPWAVDVAAAAGIPAAVLWVQSCAVFSLYYHAVHGLVVFPPEDDLAATFKLPGLPAMSVADVPSFLLPSNPFKSLTDAIVRQIREIGKARWVFVNSFMELERDAVDALAGGEVSPPPPPLIPVGPLIELDDGEDETTAVRGDMIKAADDCIGWLDSHPPRSVVYASLGSVVVLDAGEVAEMAHGLAATGRPFLWVVRPDSRELLPDGFLDGGAEDGHVTAAARGRGLVVGWSPQERVLAHTSVAVFLTHCGWNSTLETMAAGVPVVAFPQWGDQCTDAKFLVDELAMGVRLRRAPSLRRDDVRGAVDAAVSGPRAGDMLASAAAWSAACRAAVAAGGSSDRHVEAFVEEVIALQAKPLVEE